MRAEILSRKIPPKRFEGFFDMFFSEVLLKYDYINYSIIITMKSSSAAEGGRMSMGEDDDSQIN